ncbi:hypothetical protein FG386_003168 [Cryptosporidium ryanae]|uniref:uncharacterized protein n=1 Tax=Cryptosporidium ryanae TaxID=515981 RepID=UPI00351A7D6D|nr:hypothetical protein FG386_003168 [Cryptosporidium ryanae]
MSDIQFDSLENNILFEYENISMNSMTNFKSNFQNSVQRRNNTENGFNRNTTYESFKSGAINGSLDNGSVSRSVGCTRRGGKLKPRHVPDFVLISPEDVSKILSPVTTSEERKTIMNNYELGTVVLRRLCISESSEIKAFMDSIQMRTTGKALESHERNIICLTFKGQAKRWVFCPCRGCLFKGKAHDKLMGHFKIMEQESQSNEFHISKNVFDSYGIFMASTGYFAATFCPQQNYSSHKVFVGPTVSDLKGRIHDRYILYVNDAKVIQMAWRRKQNYTYDCEELLNSVMSKLLCKKNGNMQLINQINKGYSGLLSIPLKLRFQNEAIEMHYNSENDLNGLNKEDLTSIQKRNKRKLNKRQLEEWSITNTGKLLNNSNNFQSVYQDKTIVGNINSKSNFSFSNSLDASSNSQYFNNESSSLTPRCTKQCISDSGHEVDGEALTSTRYKCLLGDVSTAAATPIMESSECVNRQFNYNSKVLDCIQSMGNISKIDYKLSDGNRSIYSSNCNSQDINQSIQKSQHTSVFLNIPNQSKLSINNIELQKTEQNDPKIIKNWMNLLNNENDNPNIRSKENYIYSDFSQSETYRSQLQPSLLNDSTNFTFNPLVFSPNSTTNSILQGATAVEDESINKNFNNSYSSNSSLSIYRQAFSTNDITTPSSALEISSPIQQITHNFIPGGMIQDQGNQMNIMQQVQSIVSHETYDVFGDGVGGCNACENCSIDGYSYYCNCYKISSEATSNPNVIDVNDTSGVF